MKKIAGWFQGLKLNIKFTIICLSFVLLPMIALSAWLFKSMEDDVIDERINAMLYRLGESREEAAKNVDSINMSTQFFLSDESLREFLTAQKKGEEYSTEALLDFYNRDVASLERMVNNNTSLYQIRVYVDSDSMQEMMPVLYRKARMERLTWASDEKLYGWKYGYKDNIFATSGQLYGNKKIVSLVSSMETYEAGEIGILEVAMYMEVMFPAVYDSADGMWTCFADSEGELYFAEENDTPENRELARELLDANGGIGEEKAYFTGRKGDKLVVGIQPLKELGGCLISVKDIRADVGEIYSQRTWFIVI